MVISIIIPKNRGSRMNSIRNQRKRKKGIDSIGLSNLDMEIPLFLMISLFAHFTPKIKLRLFKYTNIYNANNIHFYFLQK